MDQIMNTMTKQINYTAYLLPTMDAQINLKAKSQAQRPNKDNLDL